MVPNKKWIVNGVFILAVLVLVSTPVGFRIKVFASKLLSTSAAMVKEGMQVPLDSYQWKLTDLENRPFDFEAQRGKVILVNFWATWCPPCVAEMPSMQKLYDDYGDKVTFMFVTSDDRQKVENFLKRKNLNLPVYYPVSETPETLKSKLLPTTYIINSKGEIVVAETGAADWNSNKTRALIDDLLSQ
ncbi:Thiol-disulfide isomerase or thioredoxin [Arenibacter palladensis]|uniref:Thiol-disulfide isomerase or thioredoxin n=1 Tax=Arenibacter palladensis TaxID=237373 RepID=A0A1M5H9G6_9FLAO|nr:TlpA disulfide reductase family protein [Arenibacter palladensis]SHG12639.1 Thiol-disulfide isomerase or thioredoxin [Arenibacter palladensis]